MNQMWIARLCLTLLGTASSAYATSAYVEQAFDIQMAINRSGSVDASLGMEYPLPESVLPFDTSIDLGIVGHNLKSPSFGAYLGAKVLLIPSLINEPSTALALRTQMSFAGDAWSLQTGPLLTFDFIPWTLNTGLYPGWASSGFDVGYEVGARYYLDDFSNNALEVALKGSLQALDLSKLSAGFRFSL